MALEELGCWRASWHQAGPDNFRHFDDLFGPAFGDDPAALVAAF